MSEESKETRENGQIHHEKSDEGKGLLSQLGIGKLKGFFQRNESTKPESTKIEDTIVMACDAGMGSSAMAATSLQGRLRKAGVPIRVIYSAIEEIPREARVVITHEMLTPRARLAAKEAFHISVRDFFIDPQLEALVNKLIENPNAIKENDFMKKDEGILKGENIKLDLDSVTKEEAIQMAGDLLVSGGYVQPEYIQGMFERETQLSTYIGKGVAIPHGVGTSKQYINHSGIVVLQFPQGVDFDGELAYLVIGIAGVGDAHLEILANLATILEEDVNAEGLIQAKDEDEILRLLIS